MLRFTTVIKTKTLETDIPNSRTNDPSGVRWKVYHIDLQRSVMLSYACAVVVKLTRLHACGPDGSMEKNSTRVKVCYFSKTKETILNFFLNNNVKHSSKNVTKLKIFSQRAPLHFKEVVSCQLKWCHFFSILADAEVSLLF